MLSHKFKRTAVLFMLILNSLLSLTIQPPYQTITIILS